MTLLFALILLVHGIAHTVGFAGAWRIGSSVPYTTTILAGHFDVGDTGIRALGVVWLALALAFVLLAVAAFARIYWWPAAALTLAAISLFMCIVAWPEAQAGAALNLGLMVALLAAMRLGWFDLTTRVSP